MKKLAAPRGKQLRFVRDHLFHVSGPGRDPPSQPSTGALSAAVGHHCRVSQRHRHLSYDVVITPANTNKNFIAVTVNYLKKLGVIGAAKMMTIHDSDSTVYLHGEIDLTIIEARCLPNMDLPTERVRHCLKVLQLCKSSKKSKKPKRNHKVITSDPYVSVCLSGATVARTRVISNSQYPVWNEHFVTLLAHPVAQVEFQVKDNDVFGADMIGVATISAKWIKSGELIEDWFPILGPFGKPPKPKAAIRIKLRFTPCYLDNNIQEIGTDESFGLKRSYFPIRHGCNVTLYQDAHVRDGELPDIKLDGGGTERGGECETFKQKGCWEDICHAILEARHLVYVIGWSIFDKVKLLREPTKPLPRDGDLTLGELLKRKSQEGVKVLLLVWDDKTSHDKFFIRTEGLMQTHDEETRKFFKHTSVNCVLAPRYASSKLSIFKQQVVGTLYTHHQKCVIVDTQAFGNYRKISAFIGGLDLCNGRYDTPQHRLFRDRGTVFENDYQNPTFYSGIKGPRQPWHDLHCKIDGPAAFDVLKNFEQRWKKATKWSRVGVKKLSHWNDDSFFKLERNPWILSPSLTVPNDDQELQVLKAEDPENWHVQILDGQKKKSDATRKSRIAVSDLLVKGRFSKKKGGYFLKTHGQHGHLFRSIDSGSLEGFPKDVRAAESQNLVGSKNLVIDTSIQRAYIQAIRSAKHFIYIENQYFFGSSYAWSSNSDAGADHLIPMELALKIASKIRANERFSVYVVVPMWPEGVPTSAAVQGILFWQGQTIQMMYEVIAREIENSELENAHPQDYLNFYCLGKRERCKEEGRNSLDGSSVSASQKNGRFMIYVHAKGMIVDDEYVILGSANINQRSMAGSRDTEIAMGAYQPHHTWAQKKSHPHGQVHGYRMSLWAEHLGKIEDYFKEPQSLACVKSINEFAEENWERFASDDFTPLPGHLLKYPIKVDPDGKVGPLPDYEHFPDVGGKILGSVSNLPNALIT